MTKPFLTAEWRDLVVINYEIDPEILAPYIPEGTELDLWNGSALVSLVAFRFLGTRVLGIPIPLHRNFEEINLRFYVCRREGSETKRGVVFIKELVPRHAIALVARVVYNENYVCVPMAHVATASDDKREYRYQWRAQDREQIIQARVSGAPVGFLPGSEAEFILDHYWGYSRARTGRTIEYKVAHAPWYIWDNPIVSVDADLALTYGEDFAQSLCGRWRSVYVAEGSEVTVFRGKVLPVPLAGIL